MTRVLVLLAARNGEQWISEQLTSLLSQRGVELSVIVGDDASTDMTSDIVEHHARTDPRVELICWAVSSGSAGANFKRLFLCADAESFDYVAFSDQDDKWHADKLSRAVRQMRSSGAHGYSSAVTAYWPQGTTRLLGQNACMRLADFLFEGAGQGCTFVLERLFFQRVQDFCRVHAELTQQFHYHDWLVYLLARAWGLRWIFDERSFIGYRQHVGNEIGARVGWAAIGRRFSLIYSGWYRRQVGTASQIYRIAGGSEVTAVRICGQFVADAANGALVGGRVTRALLLMRHGRRRLSDRLILAVACLLGYL